jgi:hypothetical protein
MARFGGRAANVAIGSQTWVLVERESSAASMK